MAEAVRELFDADYRRLGAQARSHVQAHYAWDTVVDSLLEHYCAVLGTHKPMLAHG